MNNITTFKRGDLKRRAAQTNLLQDLVFNAETNEMCDVEIITLKQHLRDKAMSRAWEIDPDMDGVDETIERLLKTKYTTSAEFVNIDDHQIKVGINTEEIDDDAVERALALLLLVDDITKKQIVTFGEEIKVHGS